MTAAASRKKKHNHRPKDDHRRSDQPERSRHARNTKERSHDRGRHTEAIEKPLNNAGKRYLPDDRADPSERVRAWVQRTQNRHPHRSLLTALDSDERLRRTSSPRYRDTDIIRGKKRGRSVSRSPSVSLEHGFDGGQVEPRFEKRRRYKTHEDKYEYKGEINRRKQPNKDRNGKLDQEAKVRTDRVPLQVINTESRMRVPDHKFAPVSRHDHQPIYAPGSRQSTSFSKVFEDRHHSAHRPLALPSRTSRQYVSAHPRDSSYDLNQDESYFSSPSRTNTVAYEQERKRRHFAKKGSHREQQILHNSWSVSKSISQPVDHTNHIRLSVERHPGVQPSGQLETPLPKNSSRQESPGVVPSAPGHIVTIVLPRYKDAETQTDPSLLAELLKPTEQVPTAFNDSKDAATQPRRGPEIQRRIQLLPDSPYSNTNPTPINEIKQKPFHQHHALPNRQPYSSEQALGRRQVLGEQRYLEEFVTNHIVPMHSRHYVQAPSSYHANGGSQQQFLGQYHASNSQPFHTNTSAEGLRIDRRLRDLVQRHEAGSPPRTMIASQQLAQGFSNRVRFQEPNSTVQRPEAPYREDMDEFIRRIEEEDLGELSDALAVEDNGVPVKTEEYFSLEELEGEGSNTAHDAQHRQYAPIIGADDLAENSDTEVLLGPRTPERNSRPPARILPRYLGQDRADLSLPDRMWRSGQGLAIPGQYRQLYET
ncbi:hypothetical protein QC764_113619 [Podospora pseudoanserina]|uniref:Uncharacterized protein n=1 Tax=Podospora pseudoanserina TaxID=2609844 RepID=A0ABR0IPT2_9PEZI|nr:hypothetical protein QC764_113619 [Podospora pseudoanserina]